MATVTVQVFKRYNFGNPNGGPPRGNIFGFMPQNELASLNADAMAKDFNVWGTTTYQVTR